MEKLTSITVSRLLREVSDLSLRVEAIWRLLEKRGFESSEIDTLYKELQKGAIAQAARDTEAAKKAAEIGNITKAAGRKH